MHIHTFRQNTNTRKKIKLKKLFIIKLEQASLLRAGVCGDSASISITVRTWLPLQGASGPESLRPTLPSAQPREQGRTSAGAEPLPEVTSECQHARWRPITGRTQPGGGKCRYGGQAPQPWRRRCRVCFPRGRADVAGRDRPGSTAGG